MTPNRAAEGGRSGRGRGLWIGLAALVVPTLAVPVPAGAQEIEPRAFSNAPIGVNFLVGGYAFTRGSLSSDTSAPITDAQLHTSNALAGYGRVFDLWGQSAKFDISIPYVWLGGMAQYAGQPLQRTVAGAGDTMVRVSVNWFGAPAMSLEEFRDYHQNVIVGTSLAITAPTGQYDDTRVVNIGTNRWSIRPVLGISKQVDQLTAEIAAGPIIFTDNGDFYGGHTRTQKPIYLTTGHLLYNFPYGIWTSLDIVYFTGGQSSINGKWNQDLQKNWRVGGTVSFPLNKNYSVKLFGSGGVSARTGNNYSLIGILLQYRWGAGL